MDQVAWAPDYSVGMESLKQSHPIGQWQLRATPSRRTASFATHIHISRNAQFKLKPLFLAVICSVERANQTRTIFTYGEVTSLLSKYILDRKSELFDHQNSKVVWYKMTFCV